MYSHFDSNEWVTSFGLMFLGAIATAWLLALWRFPWRRFERGVLTILVICAYALIRFFIEYLRADGSILLSNLTVTQLQCLFLLVSAVLLPRLLHPGRRQRAT